MDDKRYEVARNIFVYVSEIHRFGTDAVLLSDFAAPKKSDTPCDLGTGCGIIPLLWCREEYPKKITAVDIQPDAIELLKKSIAVSGLENKIEPVLADLRTLEKGYCGKYSLVTMNPPYKPVGTGIISSPDGEKITRHEQSCTFADAASAAARLLNFGGRFCVCMRPERLADIIDSMRKENLEPKRIRFVVQKSSDAPWLVMVEGKKGAKPSMQVLPNLIMRNDDGSTTDEIERIYKFYREMKQ